MVTATSTQTKLDEIAQAIVDDGICPDLRDGATQLVFGDGNPDAELVFIGEAPGKNEDIQGKPFVGAAGRFLDEMLAGIGLKREDIYITNIVKYRPPNNRDPLPEEKKAFLPYLQAQLEAIQPKVVATLGRHSMNCFLPDLQISQIHGQPKRIKIAFSKLSITRGVGDKGSSAMQGADEQHTEPYDGTAKEAAESATGAPAKPVSWGKAPQRAEKTDKLSGLAGGRGSLTLVILPLFHPAAALYNGALRQTLIDDFAAIPTILEKLDKK